MPQAKQSSNLAGFLKPLDKRIAADLRQQRVPIIKGIVCVVVASVLTGMTLGFTYMALQAIGRAAPVQVDVAQIQKAQSQDLAQELNLPPAQVEEAIQKVKGKGNETKAQVEQRQDEALRTLAFACLGVVALFSIKYVFTRGQVYYLSKASNRLASDLRVRLFDKIMRLPVSYFNSRRTGEIQSVVTNDVNVYQTAVQMVRDSIDGPVKAVIALGAVFIIKWQLGLIALALVPVLAVIVARTGKKVRSAQSKIQSDLASVSALSQEALSGIRVIKAFSAESKLGLLYRDIVEEQYRSQIVGARRIASLRPLVEVAGAVAIALIMYVCGHLARMDLLHLADIIVIVQALDQVNQGAKAITNVSSTYNQVQAAVDRIHEHVLDQPDETEEMNRGLVPESSRGRIEFKNVSFSYPDGTKALDNVSFVLEPGQSLALVGPSGSGKSTIADLTLRFYDPTEGTITFDDQDYKALCLSWLRHQFAVVPQQTFLFAGTVAENLRLGAEDAPDDRLNEAIAMANASEFVNSAPGGLQTSLGERGTRFSGGELQRLSIARALAADPAVLVLDEATSNLDPVSEKLVTDALSKVMAERTTMFIAHRLSTAARAHKIIHLRHGVIVEQGSHQELIAKNGLYAKMFQSAADETFETVDA